ncbi:MAG: TetR/AcrR family transcriptional regulator [Chloroflexota bacterium]|nr:TetR/AcrR family transcriptional regulator [Chloroflexota bacterium]
MTKVTQASPDARARIIDVAAQLLREQGVAAVTTRGVAQAAGVQAPRIYRLFGDKDGLLEAVAEHVMATFVSAKAAAVEAASVDRVDPLTDLSKGWHTQIDFGVANPALFHLLSDPERVRTSSAAKAGRRILESRVHRVAETGRLRISENRAVDLIQSAGIGVIQTLLATGPERRHPDLADEMYEAVLRQILTNSLEPIDGGTTASTVAFRAILPRLKAVSEAERQFLTEWLDRIITGETSTPRDQEP